MTSTHDLARARHDGMLFGIPLGDLGWFQTLLMSFASAFAAFFATTFLSILGLLAYMTITGRHPDFAIAYKRIGFPVGLAALAFALVYLGSLWAKRKIRKQ